MTRFSSILVANRGEIACRVMRTAKVLGYHTVAVFSEADAQAPHVLMADDAVCIGPGPVGESYLVVDKILDAARYSGAEAIHPGYGFLSENAEFARACEGAGVTFIGPSANAIELMGNKAQAKRRMLEAGVPCVPGYEGQDQSDSTLFEAAKSISMPLMVKAAAGGGGRGMRLVRNQDELSNAIKSARAEAENAFGSDELILEKAIVRPRHVEIQVFADSLGNTIHLGERDCSVQRRHQKVVEEAPCPVMTADLREKMGQAAVDAARSIDYRGAGTVEFLLDEAGEFYFLEMNTRLQVEHPVTELITGLDLVALQIQVAQGEPLGLTQNDIKLNGHAIEVRLYTEDPAQQFLPTSGPVYRWAPATGAGIRIDSGIRSGQQISPYYDPLVAKVIASGATREIARLRLIEALKETVLFGTKNNKDFLIACLENPTFAEGAATTAFIAEEFDVDSISDAVPGFEDSAIAAVIDLNLENTAAFKNSVIVSPTLKNWSSASPLVARKHYAFGDVEYDLSVIPLGNEVYRVSDEAHAAEVTVSKIEDNIAHIVVDQNRHLARFLLADTGQLYVSVAGRSALYQDQIKLAGVLDDSSSGGGRVTSPMHGMLLEVLVAAGDSVSKGDRLAVVEAMKMHYEITAECAGQVREVVAEAGNQVAADELLIDIEVQEE